MIKFKLISNKEQYLKYSFIFENYSEGIVTIDMKNHTWQVNKSPKEDDEENTISRMFSNAFINKYESTKEFPKQGMFAWW